MKKQTLAIFILYLWIRVLYGLIFYPYRTIREIVRHPVLVPVLITPFLSFLLLFFLGRFGALLLDIYGFKRYVVAMMLGTSLFSLLLWQLLLLYLLISLISAKRTK